MSDLKRAYYPLHMAAAKMGCSVVDILHLGATNRIEICAYIDGFEESEDYFSFNVFFENESDFIDEVKNNNAIITDNYEVAYFNYNEDFRIINERSFIFESWYANYLNGFFVVPSNYLLYLEFSDGYDDVKINVSDLSTPEIDGKKFQIANIEGVFISVNKLVILADELDKFSLDTQAKFPGSEKGMNESRKTIAKKANIIRAFLSLIPDLNGMDIDSMPAKKIKELVETIAANKGKEFPHTDLGTWAKYLEKGRFKA
ncbi:hypothetical protein EH228_08930 [Erwinia endophytica]|uniref:hypothetical protein n=1 Tax=Erwinia endophytica TaxID=1563158 RepID=UPI0012660067|nr:hypothetical protein [Erwinia endophytica]KAB8311960.1 hypothetical protein EH228_08930 [Erwinia endophytica]